MPTIEQLTKARDASIQCIAEGYECGQEIERLKGIGFPVLEQNEIVGPLNILVSKLWAREQDWNKACDPHEKLSTPSVLEYLVLACGRVGKTYQVFSITCNTAHQASIICSNTYLASIKTRLREINSSQDVDFYTLLDSIVPKGGFDILTLFNAVEAEWAEAVRYYCDNMESISVQNKHTKPLSLPILNKREQAAADDILKIPNQAAAQIAIKAGIPKGSFAARTIPRLKEHGPAL